MQIGAIISFSDIILAIVQAIDTVFIWINGLVYDFISFLYQIFIALSSAILFTSEQYQAIADRVYILIGVVALFLIAYALLKAIINPDNASKGDYALGKIVPNLLKVIVLIAFTPTIFSFAYKMQQLITATNVIPRIILGDTVGSDGDFYKQERNYNGEEDSKFSYETAGRTLANEVFRGFLYPAEDEAGKVVPVDKISTTTCIFRKGKCESDDDAFTFKDAIEKVNNGEEDFAVYANFAHLIHGDDKELEYNGIFQLVAGIFVIYVFVNYCIDLGLRAVKLGYFQLLAPIPILTILIPGQDKIFKNWLKQTVSTFADVFIRIAILFFGILLIQMLPSVGNLWPNSLFETNTTVENFARVFIIIGILMFIKQAPKLLSDITGLNTGSFKLGIKDKFSEALGGLESVPVAGNLASRTIGGATGALGAGWTASRNGMKFSQGAKYGWSNGWKGKGNQFNNQRQAIYTKALQGEGQAGWFGKRAFFDKMAADIDKQTKNAYKDQNFQRVAAYQKSSDWQNLYNDKYNEKVANLRSQIAEIEAGHNKAVNDYKNKESELKTRISNAQGNQERINNLQHSYDLQMQSFEAAKASERSAVQAEYDRAVAKKDISAQLDAQHRLSAIDSRQYSNPELQSKINALKAKTEDVNSLRTQLNQLQASRDSVFNSDKQSLDSLNGELKRLGEENAYINSTNRTYKTEKEFYKSGGFSDVVKSVDAAFKEGGATYTNANGDVIEVGAHPDFKDVYDTHMKNLTKEEVSSFINSAEGQKAIAVREMAEKNIGGGAKSSGSSDKKS